MSRPTHGGSVPRACPHREQAAIAIGAVGLLGAMLAVLFLTWVATAQSVYNAFFGFAPVSSMPEFFEHVISTAEGHRFLAEWCAVGLMFAIVAFSISVVSFAVLIDRRASATDAILTSLRVIARNPLTMALWGLICAGLLVVAIAPIFLGLAVVMPVLGHATWHLYRKAVSCA